MSKILENSFLYVLSFPHYHPCIRLFNIILELNHKIPFVRIALSASNGDNSTTMISLRIFHIEIRNTVNYCSSRENEMNFKSEIKEIFRIVRFESIFRHLFFLEAILWNFENMILFFSTFYQQQLNKYIPLFEIWRISCLLFTNSRRVTKRKLLGFFHWKFSAGTDHQHKNFCVSILSVIQ